MAAATPARPRLIAEIVDLATTIGAALAIMLVLRVIFFEPFTIPSSSMEPGLRTGDYLIATKFDYGWSRASLPFNPPWLGGRLLGRAPKRGDVVLFRLPRDESQVYVKRLIGLPGDRVQVESGTVFVNGAPIRQTPIGLATDPDDPTRMVMQALEARPDGRRYITFAGAPDGGADNTGVYVVPPDHYFFMGDNRDNSLDSRWPEDTGVGFVPAENLLGKARVVVASWNPGVSLFKPWTWFTDVRLNRAFRPVS